MKIKLPKKTVQDLIRIQADEVYALTLTVEWQYEVIEKLQADLQSQIEAYNNLAGYIENVSESFND